MNDLNAREASVSPGSAQPAAESSSVASSNHSTNSSNNNNDNNNNNSAGTFLARLFGSIRRSSGATLSKQLRDSAIGIIHEGEDEDNEDEVNTPR